MTTILLDDHPLMVAGLTPEAPVQRVVDAARASLSGTGRVLLGLACDGRTLGPEQVESCLTEPIARLSRIELHSDLAKPFVLDLLNETRRQFADSFASVREASDQLAAGDTTAALQTLLQCLQVWSQAHEAVVQSGGLLEINFKRVTISDRPLAEWLVDLIERLTQLREALQSRDMVLLGDILRYELDDTLQGWEFMLEEFANFVGRREPAAIG